MSLQAAIAIFIFISLRKTARTQNSSSVWNTVFTVGIAAFVALFIMDVFDYGNQKIIMWLSYILFAALVYIIYVRKEFWSAKPVLNSVLPYIAVSFLSDAVKAINLDFYNRWNNYFENAVSFALLWALGMWFMNNRQKKALEKERKKIEEIERENKITETLKAALEVQVAERTAELTNQKNELEAALTELKSTQSQLIQAEKMASLGELTAGIAHEIQNPLNFVNNFTELNAELIEELKAESLKPNAERDESLQDELLTDIKLNLEKINHHGKRADAIVKGMLQHSRKNTGVKEPTDINALADEYLRLSYHGLRAKDKSFNALFKTDFEESIGKINIVPQDMGRVLLNLFNNAFYAVSEKQKAESAKQNENYKPLVFVQTKKINNTVEMTVKDNGNGIPQHIIDKIFQPFFTTKPTGQGTGLGLSLSYDIIKAHGGTIKVESKESKGSEFIIQLATQK